jgi:hypothetical protein
MYVPTLGLGSKTELCALSSLNQQSFVVQIPRMSHAERGRPNCGNVVKDGEWEEEKRNMDLRYGYSHSERRESAEPKVPLFQACGVCPSPILMPCVT